MKIKFDPPLKHEEATCAEMVIREPTGLEVLKAAEASAGEQGAQAERVRDTVLIALVSGIDEGLVRKVPASKFKAAAAFLNKFVEPVVAPNAPRNTDPEMIIPILPRIEKMGRIVDQLELREPTTGEVEEAQRKLTSLSQFAMRTMQIHLIALVSELPRGIVEVMPISTINKASRYLLGFI